MKKKSLFFRLVVLMTFFTCAVSATADEVYFSTNGIYYRLTTYSDGRGVVSVQNNGSFNTYSGTVNIPDSVPYNGKYYPVTGIGYQAFKGCTNLNVVTLPKTIDNDLWGTDMTFGFQSAVDIATRAIDEIHTTASSHGRVFIVEVMGHKVGWLPLNAGLAGGADIILLPEIPYDLKKVIDVIEKRDKEGHRFTIIAVAEGAISKEDAKLPKKEYKKKLANYKYPSVSYELADQIGKKTGREVRVTVPGHVQRGSAPVAYDRVFASRLGAEAGNLILKGEYGFMVGYKNREMVKVPLAEVAGKLKVVDPKARIIKEAKLMGVSFGD